ncbi:MAG: HRDC domain-containing protein, partial [Duncaniella sp.]|nr:HRDC domain-containing protein [Duncaniella sp.]
ETVDHDCGNCDICLNPPERFDGTVFVLMALSGVIRAAENIGITSLVNLLRGSNNQEMREKGFDRLPTFGVGRDTQFGEWVNYITQMIQLGILDIAYNEGNHLKVTPYGRKILAERSQVILARHQPVERKTSRSRKTEYAEVTRPPAEILLDTLKEVRARLARKEGIPPYIVFTDKTLLEMVRLEPIDMESFSSIEGVGERKTVKYWRPFVTAIRRHKGIRENLGSGMSQEETLLLLNSGYDVKAIAEAKGVKEATVYSHLVSLINSDKLTDFSNIITRAQYLRVAQVARENPEKMYEILEAEMPHGLPRVALAITDYILRHKANK